MPISAPSDLSGLTMWIEAHTLALSDGDPVTNWTEAGAVTGNADDWGRKPAEAAPTWEDNVLCGEPVVRFERTGATDYQALYTDIAEDGGNRGFYDATVPSGQNIFALTEFTYFVLGRLATVANPSDFVTLTAPDDFGNDGWVNFSTKALSFPSSGPCVSVGIQEAGTFITREFYLDLPIGDWGLAEIWWDGTTLRGLLNGANEQSVALSGLFRADDGFPGMDMRITGSAAIGDAGEIAASVAYNRCLSAAERRQVRCEYFFSRYPCLNFACDVTYVPVSAWILG